MTFKAAAMYLSPAGEVNVAQHLFTYHCERSSPRSGTRVHTQLKPLDGAADPGSGGPTKTSEAGLWQRWQRPRLNRIT
jgi:hypothetical protein